MEDYIQIETRHCCNNKDKLVEKASFQFRYKGKKLSMVRGKII